MIKVNLQYEWQPKPGRGHTVEATLFRLLYAVHETGSLAAAARRIKMSYRHVWGLTGKWEKVFGKSLVTLQRGRGAELTEFGQKLLWAEQLVQARLAPELESVRQEIEQVLSQAIEAKTARLSICASHDLALAELRNQLAHRKGFKLDVRFQGSLESLEALDKGHCSLAGFHIAEGMEQSAAALFQRHLKQRQHKLIGLAIRTQGLMIGRGNPKQIQSLVDLTQTGVRIVNRQRASGSRIEFDQLLSGAGIDAGAIDGYLNEEFTHLAVAATIAGGMADAGYGIRAAAAQYKLDFIPLLTERYYLACKGGALHEPMLKDFLEQLRSAEFRQILAALPGYSSTITGKIYTVNEAFPPTRVMRASTRSTIKELS
jgi:putative molybdopterin biosynthesis protein